MLFLHLTVSSNGLRRDHLVELAAATEHLGLGITPDSDWEEAMLRVRMISQIAHGRLAAVSGGVAVRFPPYPSKAVATGDVISTVTGESLKTSAAITGAFEIFPQAHYSTITVS